MSDGTREYSYQDIADRSARYPTVGALNLLLGENPGKLVLLDADTIRIGRDPGCDLCFAVDGVSRNHVVITRLAGGNYKITDLNSTNGMFVNGFQATEQLLQDGDRVALGPNLVFCFRVLQLDEAMALEALSTSSSRDLATGAITAAFFEEMLQFQLELGQRRNFDVAMITVQWGNFREGHEEHRVLDLYAYLTGLQKPGSLTARLGPRVFAHTMSYVSRQEVDRFTDSLARGLAENFADATFFVGAACSRDLATPSAAKLIAKASQR